MSCEVANKHESPMITMLAVKDEDSMKVSAAGILEQSHAHPAGMFLSTNESIFCSDPAGCSGIESLHTIYHEYFHSLTTPYYPNLPLWVSEGLWRNFMAIRRLVIRKWKWASQTPDLIARTQARRT